MDTTEREDIERDMRRVEQALNETAAAAGNVLEGLLRLKAGYREKLECVGHNITEFVWKRKISC
jgi:hypothetical protein